MGNYSKDKDYTSFFNANIDRDDFDCPICGKSCKISDAYLEEFELTREFTTYPRPGYNVTKCAYRLCPKCGWRKDATLNIPLKLLKIFGILAIVSIIIGSIINFNKIGVYVLGGWLMIGTPLYILIWLIPNLLFWRTHKKWDFDYALPRNAIEWNPRYKGKAPDTPK